jgi:hypothetical protein
MPGLSSREIMLTVNGFIGVTGGYLGDFSYRTHHEFYSEFCNLPDIDPASDQYSGTTRERFTQILSSRPPREQAAILRGLLEKYPPNSEETPRHVDLRSSLGEWVERLETGNTVPLNNPTASRDAVLRALDDASTLLAANGPTSVVDRIHTALHGHLLAICETADITVSHEATLPAILRALRTEHPRLLATGPRAEDVTRVLQAMSQILDALNPLRNRASLAHPNVELLDEAEAMLVVNAARTIFGYLDSKLR